jgi:excisionase family DNA binding protein
VILDLDPPCWAHLWKALAQHIVWCRAQAIPVPNDVWTLLKHAECAKGRHRPTELPASLETAHGAPMDALTATYADVARRLNVSKRSIERLVASGVLPVVDVGGSRRIRVEDLEVYVASLAPRTRSFRDDIETKEAS